MITKSLYNKQSIIEAITATSSGKKPKMGQYGIKIISPSLGEIVGILKEAISFGVDASWAQLGLEGIIDSIMSSNPILGAIDTVLDASNLASGSSFTNTGIFSKLFYKNSGRLGISPSFRIFDFDGSGICTKAVTTLSALCLPKFKDGKSLSLETVTSNMSTIVDTAKDAGDKVGVTNNEFGNTVKDNTTEGLKKIGASTANWTSAPDPVSIQIGNWLIIDQAVVQSVNFQFSFECTNAGPMWVDVSMKLDSIENLSIGEDGALTQVKIGDTNKGRVNIKDSTSTTKTNYAQVFSKD